MSLWDPMDYTQQAPLSVGFFRQEYWSGLPFPPPGDLPDPGIEPVSCVGRQILYHWATWLWVICPQNLQLLLEAQETEDSISHVFKHQSAGIFYSSHVQLPRTLSADNVSPDATDSLCIASVCWLNGPVLQENKSAPSSVWQGVG